MVDEHLSLAAALAQAASEINTPRSLEEMLEAIVNAAGPTVPGFDHAGVSLRHSDGTIETLAATDQLVLDLDRAQYRIQQGPCVDAIQRGQVVVAERLNTERRWPDYLPVARSLGLRSQLGIVLAVDGKNFGGLNLYSTSRSQVDIEAVHIAQLFATHAALALGWAKHDEGLNEALRTRKVIGQAIGIVMERFQINEDRAFHFLLRTSSTSNIKLRLIAEELVTEANASSASE